MNRILKTIYHNIARNPVVERLIIWFMIKFLRFNPDLFYQLRLDKGFIFSLSVKEDLGSLLDEIPSETSRNERRFLYKFFSTIWSGKNNVIEIGPFLGGTSRAIALGMINNPKLSNEARLLVFDKFSDYYSIERLSNYLEPLFKSGVLDRSDISVLENPVDFMDIYLKIHTNHDYFKYITASKKVIPNRPEDKIDENNLLRISDRDLTDVVYVDGCKSWFGTKFFMQEVCKVSKKGTYFIFQDYGWYTCFWIPAFIELFRDHFILIGNVDTTYVFTMTKPLSTEEINKIYPDKPSDMNENKLKEIFDCLIKHALYRKDYFAVVRHNLHKAGAMAYIGNLVYAKEIIINILNTPWSNLHKKVIKNALKSPTYNPDGQIFLK